MINEKDTTLIYFLYIYIEKSDHFWKKRNAKYVQSKCTMKQNEKDWIISSVGVVKGQIRRQFVRDVQIDDPIHEVETGKGHRKDDPRIFVDGRRRCAKHFVEILSLDDERQLVIHHRCHLDRYGATGSVVYTLKTNKKKTYNFFKKLGPKGRGT